MDNLENIYRLHKILRASKKPVSQTELAGKLACSEDNLKSLIQGCKDYLESPIEFDKEQQGYFLDGNHDSTYELPGLWFNADEIYALMTSHRLLSEVRPGLLEPHISPLKERLQTLLQNPQAGSEAIFDRVRILQMTPRVSRLEDFQVIASALISRQQLRIQYQSRGSDDLTERWVSPQRLIYYRDNWYLDAWCHLRKALRTFSLDRMNASERKGKAIEISDKHLDEHFTQSYGIFSGAVTGQAMIRFSSEVARWVADERWHPEQQYTQLDDGGCELTVPFSDPSELIMDILKYGPDAEVLGPEPLRKLLEDKLSKALRKYRSMR